MSAFNSFHKFVSTYNVYTQKMEAKAALMGIGKFSEVKSEKNLAGMKHVIGELAASDFVTLEIADDAKIRVLST